MKLDTKSLLHKLEGEEEFSYQLGEIFFGPKTLFSLFAFSIGIIVASDGILTLVRPLFSPWTLIIFGVSLFVLAGLYIGSFEDKN